MRRYCAACGSEAIWLSMRALCPRCQQLRGALHRRNYDWRTGKLKAASNTRGW